MMRLFFKKPNYVLLMLLLGFGRLSAQTTARTMSEGVRMFNILFVYTRTLPNDFYGAPLYYNSMRMINTSADVDVTVRWYRNASSYGQTYAEGNAVREYHCTYRNGFLRVCRHKNFVCELTWNGDGTIRSIRAYDNNGRLMYEQYGMEYSSSRVKMYRADVKGYYDHKYGNNVWFNIGRVGTASYEYTYKEPIYSSGGPYKVGTTTIKYELWRSDDKVTISGNRVCSFDKSLAGSKAKRNHPFDDEYYSEMFFSYSKGYSLRYNYSLDYTVQYEEL